jgi:acyl-CoA thioester hydrolase
VTDPLATSASPAPPGDGWFTQRVAVRFRDIDAMGHAHHSLPLIYLEEARAAFWRALKGRSELDSIDYVMAEVTLRFHARITWPGELTVRLGITTIGNRSFTTAFEIAGADGTLLSSGSAVQVLYDYAAGRSRAPTEAERAVLERWRDARQKNMAMVADTMPITPPST